MCMLCQTRPEFDPPIVTLPTMDGRLSELNAFEEAEAILPHLVDAFVQQFCTTGQHRKNRGRSTRARNTYRAKSERFVVELDCMLRAPPHFLLGLKRFQAPDKVLEVIGDEPLSWPTLVLSTDQCFDCPCAYNWMLAPDHGRMRLAVEPYSHNHSIHNDTMNARAEAGLGGACYAAAIFLNLFFTHGLTGSMATWSEKQLHTIHNLRMINTPHIHYDIRQLQWRRASMLRAWATQSTDGT